MSKSNQAFTKQMDDDYLSGRLIRKEDAPLHIDVYCYVCKRQVALSNTREIDGRRYCLTCRAW